MSLSTLARFALVLSIPAAAVACAVDSGPEPEPVVTASGGGPVPVEDGGMATTLPASNGAPSEHPILAPIDTDQTMVVSPGEGAGVFTEYDAGGYWHVWWTCDLLAHPQNSPCQFDVKISVQSGTISTPATQGFATSDTFSSSGTQIEGVTTTTTASDGVTFQTAPGAVITLSATIGGQYDGAFIFFVEGKQVDDGYTGTVTDPIMLQGSTP